MGRIAVILVAVICGPILIAQQPAPAFEVASVKLHTADGQRTMMVMQPGGRLLATNVPLRHVIRTAFQVQDDQIVSGPSWLGTDRFDINAKAPDGMRPEQIAPMLQALLTERFNLQTHHEVREVPVFALERVRRDGPIGAGLRPTACPELAVDLSQPKPCANISNGVNFLTLQGAPIAVFAQYLAPYVNRVVIDRTGLDGRYDIVLKWSPEQQVPAIGAAPGSAGIQDRPYLFTALQEQLGLRLESSRGPVEVLVIDSVEHLRPTDVSEGRMTRVGLFLVLLVVTSLPLTSQTPAFEVASVKPSAPDSRGMMISGPTPSQFTTRNAPLERDLRTRHAS